MASTNSLLTGLSGLTAHTRRLEVIGNNIANVNTTAFKSNRLSFAPTLSRTFSAGTGPSATHGGSNPGQVGLGVAVAGSQRNFNIGPINATGVKTDLALEGDGFFIVDNAGKQAYTRDGAFRRNSEGDLVTLSGARVQGYSVDQDFNLISSAVGDINIPLGQLTVAEATTRISLKGNLSAAEGEVATKGSVLNFAQEFKAVGGGILAGNTPIVGAAGLEDPKNPGNPLFPAANAPYKFTVRGGDDAQKGKRGVPERTLEITATTTMDDLAEFLSATFGIVDGVTTGSQTSGVKYTPGTAGPPAKAGTLAIVGNTGEANDITFNAAAIRIKDAAGKSVTNPFQITQAQKADGESVRAGFVAYDSLGNEVDVQVTFVYESAVNNSGSVWRYYVESADNADRDAYNYNVANGTVAFDAGGNLVDTAPISVTVGREGVGSEDAMAFVIDLKAEDRTLSALANGADKSAISGEANGVGFGTLVDYEIGKDGVINGRFDNGENRAVGQVAVGVFSNPAGLVDAGNNLFSTGPNSGDVLVTSPGRLGAGTVRSGHLEGSNTELGAEFINMIMSTTGYSASSRVITTSDELLQQLVVLGR